MNPLDSRFRAALAAAIGVLLISPPLVPEIITVGGGCSLAEAITAANTDSVIGGCTSGSGADELRLSGNVTLDSVLPSIDSTITIRGNGFRVRRHPSALQFRIFEVPANGDLTLDNVVVSGGVAESGGGIFNKGALAIFNSTVSGNVVTGLGGGGGGIYTGGFGSSFTLASSTVSGNSSSWQGGGIEVRSGYAVVSESHVDANYAAARGGGIHKYGGDVVVIASTISNNTVPGDPAFPDYPARGGGVFATDSVTLIDSTISGNSIGADFGKGGGLYNYYGGTFGAPVTLTNTTVTGNTAPEGEAIHTYIATTMLVNSAINGSCTGYNQPVDGGNNFGCGFGSPPGLDPVLADNGGPTPTHALLPGSPAIDAAGSCGSAADQRGFGRNGPCDSGAYEVAGVRPAVGGSTAGVQGLRVLCSNRTSGQRVSIPLGGSGVWDCEGAGLVVGAGDTVEQVVIGEALSATIPLAGSVSGMRLESVSCRNLTSGNAATIVQAGLGASWDCSAAGMAVGGGDRIRVSARGSGD